MKTAIQHSTRREPALSLLACGLLGSVLLSGCGTGSGGPASGPVSFAGPALQGKVFGGQQPVSGSTIQLYAAGGSGYGSSATTLISSTVKTNSGGQFGITNTYTCPSSTSEVYLTATGGNSGSGNNPNLAMMAALGPCGALNANTFISLNELTTVGSVWVLAPFMTGPANLGTSGTNTIGLVNAFTDVGTLVNIASGSIPGPAAPTSATVPTAEMNTLADILAACINSSGGAAGDGSPCGMLFSAANPGGTMSTAPTDTLTAAMNIAQHPGLNISSLYALTSATGPFQPTLATQPKDFTIAVNYASSAFSTPTALAADSQGNVWITNSGANTATKLLHTGAVSSSYTGSLNLPSSVAVDSADGVWITNKGNSTVSHLSSAGTSVAGSPYSGGGLNQPNGISLDNVGNVWISNGAGASVSELSSSGAPLSGTSGYAGSGTTATLGIVVSPH